MTPTAVVFPLALALLASPLAQAASYSYDSLGRLISVGYDDGASISYSYDPAGNLLSLTQNPATTRVQMASPTLAVDESGTTATLTLIRSGSLAGSTRVSWSAANGSAQIGSDYGGAGSSSLGGTILFAPGEASKTLVIPLINDSVIETAEGFTVSLSNPIGGSLGSSATSVTSVTIGDNDSQIALATPTASVAENAGTLSLTVTRRGSLTSPASLGWSTTNGTAQAGTHFGTAGSTGLPAGTLNFAANVASATISIPIITISSAQGDKNFSVNLGTASGATVDAANKTATVTISDQTRILALAASTLSVAESAGNAVLTVNRTGTSSGAVSVNYSTTNATATAGADFGSYGNSSALTGTLSWASGDLAAKTIVLPLINDSAVEVTESFTVSLNTPSAGVTLGTASASVSLQDDDSNLQFSTPTSSVAETTASINLTVSRSGTLSSPASVSWTAANGSATAGVDYGIAGNATPPAGTLNFAATTSSAVINIPILNDSVFEGNETFSVSLNAPAGATLGVNTQSTVSIVDNDIGVQFDSATYTVSETTGAGSVSLKLTRVGPIVQTAQSVAWAAVNGSAIAGQDYGTAGIATPPSGTVSWLTTDATTLSKTIVIPILIDTLAEADENFSVVLSTPVGLALASPAIATVTLWDNDSPPESRVQFAQSKAVVAETAGSAALTVTRTGDVHRAASVTWKAANGAVVAGSSGNAMAGSDYGTAGSTTVPTGTLAWAAGDGTAKSITMPILNDSLAETTESFDITLSAPSISLGLGSIATMAVVIEDDDEIFPPGGKLPAQWSTPGGAVAGWHISEDSAAAEGKYVLKTDTVFDGEPARIQVAGNFAAGTVSFKLKVASEPGADVLRFYIDGVKMGEWSGALNSSWTATPGYALTAGSHTLQWSYEKDHAVSLGADAAWIDAVLMPAVQ